MMSTTYDPHLGPRAIVLGAEHPRALAVIQSLGSAGINVITIDHRSAPLGFLSRYSKTKIKASPGDSNAMTPLIELQNDGGVIIPTNDRYLILVSKNFDYLSRYFLMTTPPWTVLEPMMDITRLYKEAGAIGIKTPAFFKPSNEPEMLQLLRDLDFSNHSYLLRTVPGTVPADQRNGRFTKVAGSDERAVKDNFLDIYRRTGAYPILVRVVPGEADRCIGVCMVVNKNHEAVLCYCLRRLKLFTYSRGGQFVHPYELGANVYCESVHDNEAVEAARRLVEHMRYYGPIALEFRRDSRDDSLVLIKADPRPVRATSLSKALGLDFPLALYREFTSNKAAVPASYADGIAWVWVSAYLSSLWGNRKNRSVVKELLSLAKHLFRIKAVANLDFRDPLPFLVEQTRWWHASVNSMVRTLRTRLAK